MLEVHIFKVNKTTSEPQSDQKDDTLVPMLSY